MIWRSGNSQDVEKLLCVVRSRDGVLLNCECESVSLVNKIGNFDVLPEHINFVSEILEGVIVRRKGLKDWRTDFVRGVLRVTSNKIDVVILN